ncbi:MAG: ABC transporter ATP-binding protein [Candidatus Margulisbacteria bacterium]|nr:ABC transporter ATP-binding protein [Candidatus Margulisiibacteriota bacterium]
MLEVKNLSVSYFSDDQVIKAVDAVSFKVETGSILGIVGESGSGKSTIAQAIMRLIAPPGKITGGEIIFDGQDLLELAEKEMIGVRGARISMIFQDPFTSLNPVITLGEQIAEAIRLHQGLNNQDAWAAAVRMLEAVHIKQAAKRARDYPHQFSGGMRQRAMIAMALSCRPEILIADEPTTALDATIQAEIIRLLKEVQAEFNLSVIYITHNFGIIKAFCRDVIVIEKGRVAEAGPVDQLLTRPQSPYTQRLLNALKILSERNHG